MSSKRYPEEFNIEAVRQVTDQARRVGPVADRLGVTTHSLYAWLRKYGPDSEQHQAKADDQAEIRRLQKELKRVTEWGWTVCGLVPNVWVARCVWTVRRRGLV